MDASLDILIVDDEPEARELLNYMLNHEQGVKVTGMAGHVDEAIRFVREKQPDLIFLDIQMPDKDGFHFIDQLHQEGYEPGIIFVTAHDNYAIRAIRNSVFDYILKPLHQEELKGALDRFRKQFTKGHKQELIQLLQALKESGHGKIKLNTRSGYILIDPREVLFCKADGNYTHIQLVNGNQELITQNLGTIEESLQGDSFFRASRSYLLNLRFLSRVDRKCSSCVLENQGASYSIRIPAQKIRMLEASFSR